MAQSKNSPKSTGIPGKSRRTRRKPRPVTIDLEATEIPPEPSKQTDSATTNEADASEKTQDASAAQSTSNDAPNAGDASTVEMSSGPTSDASSNGAAAVSSGMIFRAISYCLAAIVGGVISLLVYFWFTGLGWLPGTAGPDMARMENEISTLRSGVALVTSDVETLTGQSVDDAQSRIAALESGSAKLADLANLAEDIDGLQSAQTRNTQALTAVDAKLAGLAERANLTEVALTSTTGFVEEFAQQLSAISAVSENRTDAAGADGAGIAAISDRIATLESIINQVGDPANAAVPVSVVQIAALRSEIDSIQNAAAVFQRKLQAKVTTLETQLLNLQTSMQISATDIANLNDAANDRLQAINSALANLAAQGSAGPVSQIERRAALAISFAALGRAMDSGKSFKVELETALAFAAGTSGNDSESILGLKSLAPHAETGINSAQSLAVGFAEIANAIIDAGNPDKGSGLLDRAWSGIRSIVRVRPTGFVEGDSAAAIVARTENLLQSGQIAEAIAELETLPELSRAAADAWLESANARVNGNAVLAKLNAGLIANVGAGGETSNRDQN